MNYDKLTLDQLFAALRLASIAEYEAGDDEPQHAAARAEGVLVREIAKREGIEPFYRRLLTDEHPSVRYRGALGIKKTDPSAAMDVLRDLSNSRLQAGLSVISLQALMALEKLGVE